MTNKLSAADSSFEASLGTWRSTLNATLTRAGVTDVIAGAADGTHFLKATPVSTGQTMGFRTGFIPVSPSTTYWLQGSFSSSHNGYTASFTVTWYSAALGQISSATETVALNTGSFGVVDASHGSPAGAAFARLSVTGPGTPSIPFGLDRVGLSTTSTWALGTGSYSNPPNAPTLNSPPTGTTVDRTSTQRFTWTFSDPDPGDSQSKFDLRYSHDSGATWTTVTGVTPNNYLDVASGTFIDGATYQWQVRTYDNTGTVGAWSASSFFTAATPAAGPTITTPTSGATINTTPSTVTWSFPDQQGYQVRRVADSAGAPDTGTVYYDTGQVTDTDTRSVDVPFETNNRFEHVQVRVETGGLWSAWVDALVDVSYTAPPVPRLTIAADPDSAAIDLSVTTPAPVGSNPAAVSVDIYRSDDDGVTSIRLATGLPISGDWTDTTPASGVEYAYQAVAYAGSGVTTASGWTHSGGPFTPGIGFGVGPFGVETFGGAA